MAKQTKEIIEVDVQRSFYSMPKDKVNGQNLTKILNTYGIVNKRLDYCQGMNFIAGFLYLFLEDEALAFGVMREVIKKNDMSSLFNTEEPML